MKQYMTIAPDGRVDSLHDIPDGDDPPTADGFAVAEVPMPFAGWPAAPTPTSVLHWQGGSFVWKETATLDEIKAAKSAEITRDRIATDSDRFVYQGLSIRTADKDIFDLLIADARISKGQGMPPNWPGGWKAIENSYVLINTVDEWNAFFIAMYDAGISNFNRSQQLKAQVSAATTAAEVTAIQWNQPTGVA